MRMTLFACAVALFMHAGVSHGKRESYEDLEKSSTRIYNLKGILLPFVKTCDRERTSFRRRLCGALNERLKAQHQAKTYRMTFTPSAEGPLVARFRAKPAPMVELVVRGCLTCREPFLERAGGDVSKGRFFVFKVPQAIRIRRGSRYPYDLREIDVASYTAALPKGTTEKKFKAEVLPHLMLDVVFRPVAGLVRVGAGRFKYGVTNFELVGHRAYHKCGGKVYGVAPEMKGTFVVDKNDLSCPQNQPKKVVAKAKLPATLPQRQVKRVMALVSRDLMACYEQFGVAGGVPTDIVISPSGRVKHVKVVGSLSGTPTGHCVERMVKHLTFPKFSGDDARLQWPFALSN